MLGIINNLYFFTNKINSSKKSKVFNLALLMFLAFFAICQSLAISHLSSHNFQNHLRKNQNIFIDKNISLKHQISQINSDEFVNCDLCFLANLQKKINNLAVIFIAVILINLIFKTKLQFFNFTSKTSALQCRAPPFFA